MIHLFILYRKVRPRHSLILSPDVIRNLLVFCLFKRGFVALLALTHEAFLDEVDACVGWDVSACGGMFCTLVWDGSAVMLQVYRQQAPRLSQQMHNPFMLPYLRHHHPTQHNPTHHNPSQRETHTHITYHTSHITQTNKTYLYPTYPLSSPPPHPHQQQN